MNRYYLLLVSGEQLDHCNQYVTAVYKGGEFAFSVKREAAHHFLSLAMICEAIYAYGDGWEKSGQRRPRRVFTIVRVEEVTPAPVVTETVVE